MDREDKTFLKLLTTLFSFFNLHVFYLYECFTCMYVSVPHVCLVPSGQKRMSGPLEVEFMDGFEALGVCGVWAHNTPPLPPPPTPTDACRGRGVRFPLRLKLERIVSCLRGVLGIEVRLSWRAVHVLKTLALFIFKILMCTWPVCGSSENLQELVFSTLVQGSELRLSAAGAFTRWAAPPAQGFGFQIKLWRHFSHLCRCRCWI